jgi:arabinose-5-phosphate isomerase
MTKTPITIQTGEFAVEALNVLKRKNISCLPVINENKVIGIIRLQDIIGVGIVG